MICNHSLLCYTIKKTKMRRKNVAKKYSEIHQIPYYECDTENYLKIPTMIKMLIKISEDQSASLGVSDEFVLSLGLGWIILQHDLTIHRLPQAGESIKLVTEAESYNKYFCYRNFWIYDEAGKECVHMETTFALMDLKERKMGSVPDEVIAPFESEKIKRIKRGEKILPLETAEREEEYRVRYYDIDGNKHVNNSVYLDWMLDVLSYEFLSTHVPKTIFIKFNKEVRYGESVMSRYQHLEEGVTRHQISFGGDASADANMTWGKR